jgi:hypothetical protein
VGEWAFIASGTNAKHSDKRMKAVPTEKEMLWDGSHNTPVDAQCGPVCGGG